MEIKATEQLKEEHKVIKLMLQVLIKICEKLESGEKVPIEHLNKIVDFIRTFADKCHHGKEEDLLFPAMEKSGVPREEGPIGVMLAEHDNGRKYVKNMDEAISRYGRGDNTAIPDIIANAEGYINLLAQHIEKEDNILYKLADMHLPMERQEELLKEFEKIERERIGIGKHEEFHELIHQLRDIYLQ